ncbi:MAG: non-homologous end joining protein Ku [Phycisphaerae bacterium]
MRPIWKGHITFGLVNVPVTLYPAEQRSELSLHMVDSRNSARVKYERVNAQTGEEVPWDRIVKGYEYEEGNYVLLTDEELKRAAPEVTKSVEIAGFVDLAEIDLVYFDTPYYLEPGPKGEKAYVLLRETLKESGKAGIAKVVIRTRQYIAALVPRGDALILNLLRYHAELRSLRDLKLPSDAQSVGVTKAELKMARTLVASMEEKWKPDQYHDEYRQALMNWIQKKIDTGRTEPVAEGELPEEEAPAPINIMEALKRSLAHAEPRARTTQRKAPRKEPSRRKAG